MMMRGERCTLWHGRHTKEAHTLRVAQSRKVPFQSFRISHYYHAGCPVPQGNGIGRGGRSLMMRGERCTLWHGRLCL